MFVCSCVFALSIHLITTRSSSSSQDLGDWEWVSAAVNHDSRDMIEHTHLPCKCENENECVSVRVSEGVGVVTCGGCVGYLSENQGRQAILELEREGLRVAGGSLEDKFAACRWRGRGRG